MVEEELVARTSSTGEEDLTSSELTNMKERKNKRKKRLQKEMEKADKHGVCYLSRVPPHMDPLKLRQTLFQYGEIQRIYLTLEAPTARIHRKKASGFESHYKNISVSVFRDKFVHAATWSSCCSLTRPHKTVRPHYGAG